MFIATELGKQAADMHKQSLTYRRGRSGRMARGDGIKKQLHAAGQPKMNTPGVIGFPRGRSV